MRLLQTEDFMKNYPKTEKYDLDWIEQNWMGPNPLGENRALQDYRVL